MRFLICVSLILVFVAPCYSQRSPFPRLTKRHNEKRVQLSVEMVARQLDGLQQLIEEHGSIVPKQPDIWGEARLTKHRYQVELELAKNLSGFRETLNGSLRRSDQSYLSTALAISSATGRGDCPKI